MLHGVPTLVSRLWTWEYGEGESFSHTAACPLQPWPTEYLVSAATSFLTCTALFLSSSRLSAALWPSTYPKLTRLERIEWDSRLVSNVHAVISTLLCAYVYVSEQLWAQDVYLYRSPIASPVIGVTGGYLAYDLLCVLWYWRPLGTMSTVVHHVTGIWSFSMTSVRPSLLRVCECLSMAADSLPCSERAPPSSRCCSASPRLLRR